jgi:hypothetical protein
LADWLKFSLIEHLTYEIDVIDVMKVIDVKKFFLESVQEKFLTNDALDLIGSPIF